MFSVDRMVPAVLPVPIHGVAQGLLQRAKADSEFKLSLGAVALLPPSSVRHQAHSSQADQHGLPAYEMPCLIDNGERIQGRYGDMPCWRGYPGHFLEDAEQFTHFHTAASHEIPLTAPATVRRFDVGLSDIPGVYD